MVFCFEHEHVEIVRSEFTHKYQYACEKCQSEHVLQSAASDSPRASLVFQDLTAIGSPWQRELQCQEATSPPAPQPFSSCTTARVGATKCSSLSTSRATMSLALTPAGNGAAGMAIGVHGTSGA